MLSIVSSSLEAEPTTKLQRSRSTSSEELAQALRWLTKAERCRHIAWCRCLAVDSCVYVLAKSGQVRDVKQVENLKEELSAVALLELEGLRYSDILRLDVVTEVEVWREHQEGYRVPQRVMCSSLGCVELIYKRDELALANVTSELINAQPRQCVVCRPVAFQ